MRLWRMSAALDSLASTSVMFGSQMTTTFPGPAFARGMGFSGHKASPMVNARCGLQWIKPETVPKGFKRDTTVLRQSLLVVISLLLLASYHHLKWHPPLALAALAGTCPEKRPPRPLHSRFFLPVPLIDPRRRRCLRFPATILELCSLIESSRRSRGASTGLRVLSKLQLAFEHHQLGLMNVWPNTIVWLDQKEHTNLSKWREGDFDYSRTIRPLAYMVQLQQGKKGETGAEWKERPFHMWVLLTHHAPEGHTRLRPQCPRDPSGGRSLPGHDVNAPRAQKEDRSLPSYDLNAPRTQTEVTTCQATNSMPPEPKRK
ncbi:hypothetical protein B0H14DRAFT_3587316 [Mycena olivaceomarginata]|nr:hypothetical protein B0H14DRAFT_3587316 [Mycena olivaceomarginata]